MKTCSVNGCRAKIHAKNLCQKHYGAQQYSLNKNHKKVYGKAHYLKNRDRILARTKKYGSVHKKEQKIRSRRHYLLNKERIKKRSKLRTKFRLAHDPKYKLRKNVSLSIYHLIVRSGSSKSGESILRHLPYSIETLKTHLEKQFEPWMSWSTYGKFDSKNWDDNNPTTWVWNIDHIIPQSKLPYASMEDENFKKCWALDNLRPLSAKQNFLDRDR